MSPKQLETGGFERAGAGDCGSLETGIIFSWRGDKNAKDDTLWKEVDAEESNWELEKDWLLRCGIGRTSLLDSCEYLEICQIFLSHFESVS